MCIRDSYLTAWKEGFFNSYVESESYEAKNLGEGYSLCIANLALLVPVSYTHLDVYKRQP